MEQANPACLVCGAPLVYQVDSIEMTCENCGKACLSNASCEKGHYICDDCHGAAGRLAIRWHCARSDLKNPVAITQSIMNLPEIHMHGPEHHCLVGSALLTAYKNSGGDIDLDAALRELEKRSRAVPGGICGLWGCCGAAVSAGMFMSIATSATPFSTETWGLSNRMTAACLASIGTVGGPRCCKRDSFLALRTAIPFTAEHLGIQMDLPAQIICTYAHRNRDCLGSACPFHAAL